MARQDDPSIDGDVLLFRRIPNRGGRVDWDKGIPVPSSQNFSDANKELSLHLAHETTPEILLEGEQHTGFGVVSISAGAVRKVCRDNNGQPVIVICRDDVDPANGHVLVIGKITTGMRTRIRAAARWVILPTPETDTDSPTP